jgi:phospholipid/cholesterol/gamma-HCH transport system substrate-binding protein
MNERTMQFRVGVTILAAILCAAILVLFFMGESPMLHGTYTIYIKFSDAPGVTRDTPVRKAGIRIGRVQNVQFAEDDGGVVVTAQIDRGRILYNNEQCRATNSLLMGDATLEFVRNPSFQGEKTQLENGTVLQGQMPADMTASIAGLQGKAAMTLDTLNTAGRDMHEVLTRVDRLMATNETRVNHMIVQADETMQLVQKALTASNDILGDPKLRGQIKETIAEMPAVLKQTRATVERVAGTFDALKANMENIEPLSKKLGEGGPSLVDELQTSLKNLDELSYNLMKFSEKLSDPPGSLGALLHDKGELFQHVNHIAKTVDELTRDLKPILDNLGILSDKLARHPSTLGVRGALEKDNGFKNAPANDGSEPAPPETRRWPLGGSGQWSIGNGQ